MFLKQTLLLASESSNSCAYSALTGPSGLVQVSIRDFFVVFIGIRLKPNNLITSQPRSYYLPCSNKQVRIMSQFMNLIQFKFTSTKYILLVKCLIKICCAIVALTLLSFIVVLKQLQFSVAVIRPPFVCDENHFRGSILELIFNFQSNMS